MEVEFADRLRELISENLTTVSQAGAELGCGEATLSKYATGRALPSLSMAVRLADYFDVNLDYLLGITDDSEESVFLPCPPFGQRLKEVCREFNVSRYRLQKLTGISESVMRYWVTGRTEPSIVSVMKIADALGCSTDFLVGRIKN